MDLLSTIKRVINKNCATDVESTFSVNCGRWISRNNRPEIHAKTKTMFFKLSLLPSVFRQKESSPKKNHAPRIASVQLEEASYREAYTSTSSPTTRRRRHPRGGQKVCRLPSWRAMPSYFEDRASSTTTTTTTGSCRFRVVSWVPAAGTWRRANDSWLICESRRRRMIPARRNFFCRETTEYRYLDGSDIDR